MSTNKKGVALEIMTRCNGDVTVEQLTETLAAAFEDYVTKGLDSEGLTKKYPAIPVAAFRYAARKMGWLQRRREYLEEVTTAADVALAQSLLTSRRDASVAINNSLMPIIPSIASQLEAACQRAEDGGADSKYATTDIRRLSEAMKLVSDTLIKSSGGEHGFITQLSKGAGGDGADAKVPWMSIVAQGPLSISSGNGSQAEPHTEEGDFEDVD